MTVVIFMLFSYKFPEKIDLNVFEKHKITPFLRFKDLSLIIIDCNSLALD